MKTPVPYSPYLEQESDPRFIIVAFIGLPAHALTTEQRHLPLTPYVGHLKGYTCLKVELICLRSGIGRARYPKGWRTRDLTLRVTNTGDLLTSRTSATIRDD